MKMKKFLSLVCCLTLCLFAINFTCYAESETDGSSFYVTGEKLDQIFEALQGDSYGNKIWMDDYSVTIVKESITPVYSLDVIEYARTGELNVLPQSDGRTEQKGNVYAAKLITADGQFAGNIIFYIDNGRAYRMYGTLTEYTTDPAVKNDDYLKNADIWDTASFSYADHAARISEDMGKKDFVSANDVKFVWITPLGFFFEVTDGEQKIYYGVGSVPRKKANQSQKGLVNYSLNADQLLEEGKRCLEREEQFLKEKAEWEAQHPGELWNKTGDGGISPVISSCSHIENVLDIASYLNIDYGTATKQELNIKSPNNAIKNTELILIGIAVVLVLSAVAVAVSIKKNSKKAIYSLY